MATAPTIALEPGSTNTAAVKQLQDWLVSQGYLTQTQVNTGYGIYGPQTTAAVLAYQKASGVDYGTYGGYWGPKTISTVSGTPATSSTPAPTSTTTSTSAPASTAGSQPITSWNPYGITIPSGSGQRSDGIWVDGNGNPLPGQGIAAPAPASTSTSTTQTASTGLTAPSVNLKPNDTGDQVKALQDYLVSKGFLTQAQVDTGYGTYGPQTTAAVKALQESLGVDNSSGVGYWGPRTIAAVGSSTAGATGGTTTNPELESILNNPNLTADQKAAIQSIYGAVSTNDADRAAKIQAALTAASQFSDPYFKAQTRLAIDALTRGISGKDGDLAYQETALSSALQDLRDSTAASTDKLSFEHAQDLRLLEQKYDTDLNSTRDNLAASGFTSSSKRARAEEILTDNNTGLVESSNKNYGYQTGNLARNLSSGEASTQAQIDNLRRVNDEGKLDLYRTTEGTVGSDNLPSLDGLTALGGVGGDIPRKQATDAFSFASNFVT